MQHFLHRLAQHVFLSHLERSDLFPNLQRSLFPHSLASLLPDTAAFHNLGELCKPLSAQELDDRHPPQQIDGDVPFFFRPPQRGKMNIGQQPLDLGRFLPQSLGPGFSAVRPVPLQCGIRRRGRRRHRTHKHFAGLLFLYRRGIVLVQYGLDATIAHDEPPQMRAHLLAKPGA